MSRRSEKVAAELHRQLAVALLVAAGTQQLLTLTHVTVTDDLRYAKIYIAGWGKIDSNKQSHIRHVLATTTAQVSTMKFVPRLHISDDASADYAAHISRLLEIDIDPSDESA